jgi:hypothetical protein
MDLPPNDFTIPRNRTTFLRACSLKDSKSVIPAACGQWVLTLVYIRQSFLIGLFEMAKFLTRRTLALTAASSVVILAYFAGTWEYDSAFSDDELASLERIFAQAGDGEVSDNESSKIDTQECMIVITRNINPSCGSGPAYQKKEIVISLRELEKFGKLSGTTLNFVQPYYLPEIEKQFSKMDQLITAPFAERRGEQRSANVAAYLESTRLQSVTKSFLCNGRISISPSRISFSVPKNETRSVYHSIDKLMKNCAQSK